MTCKIDEDHLPSSFLPPSRHLQVQELIGAHLTNSLLLTTVGGQTVSAFNSCLDAASLGVLATLASQVGNDVW
jgi:hypothetical protein